MSDGLIESSGSRSKPHRRLALHGWILSFQESKSETVKRLVTILNFNVCFIT